MASQAEGSQGHMLPFHLLGRAWMKDEVAHKLPQTLSPDRGLDQDQESLVLRLLSLSGDD